MKVDRFAQEILHQRRLFVRKREEIDGDVRPVVDEGLHLEAIINHEVRSTQLDKPPKVREASSRCAERVIGEGI